MKVLELEEGWEIIQKGITKLINILEADESPIDVEEGWEIIQNEFTEKINIVEGVSESLPIDGNFNMQMYDAIYTLCNQKPPHDYSEKIYKRYKRIYKNYLRSIVLPAIQEKLDDDVSMLQELVTRWENHKVMVKKLSRCFSYLDRCYIRRKGLPNVKAVGFNCFDKIVGEKMKDRVKDAANLEGEEIDQTLMKNALDIFVELENPQNMKDDPPKYESYISTSPSFNDASWLGYDQMFPGYDSWLGYDSMFPGYDPTDSQGRLFF